MQTITRSLALPLLLAAVGVAGCDSTADNAVEGTYTANVTGEGLFTDDSDTATLTLTIDDVVESGPFSFSGTAAADGVSIAFAGTGRYTPPDVTMTLTIFGQTATLTGTVSEDGDTITVTDGEIDDEGAETRIVFRRTN